MGNFPVPRINRNNDWRLFNQKYTHEKYSLLTRIQQQVILANDTFGQRELGDGDLCWPVVAVTDYKIIAHDEMEFLIDQTYTISNVQNTNTYN